MIRWKRKGKEL